MYTRGLGNVVLGGVDPGAVAIIGAGGFGTSLSILLAQKGVEVRQWCRSKDLAETMNNRRENSKYLPGVKIPLKVWVTTNLQDALEGCQTIVMAVPSQAMRPMAEKVAKHIEPGANVVSVAKGLEHDTYLRMSEVLRQVLPASCKIAALSGPNHAEEIARGQPGATVIASNQPECLPFLCELFTTQRFKAYPRRDVVGVELGGVLKNIIALACGVAHGAGFGDNSTSAVLTLGLDEMVRFGVNYGAKMRTFTGLSGLGDLIATATSEHSRNRRLGNLVGRGLTYQEAIATMNGQVAEGVFATKFVHEMAIKDDVPLPLTAEMYKILYEQKPVEEAISDLLLLL